MLMGNLESASTGTIVDRDRELCTKAATECRTSTEANTSSQDLNSHGCLPVNTRSSFFRITELLRFYHREAA